VTSTEGFLVLASVGLATFVLSASVLGRTRAAWPNSVRVLELLADRRRALFFALLVYALGALGLRFATAFILPIPTAATSAGEQATRDLVLDVGVFGASILLAVLVAAVAWLSRAFVRFRRR
jgi:hypothetical protein